MVTNGSFWQSLGSIRVSPKKSIMLNGLRPSLIPLQPGFSGSQLSGSRRRLPLVSVQKRERRFGKRCRVPRRKHHDPVRACGSAGTDISVVSYASSTEVTW